MNVEHLCDSIKEVFTDTNALYEEYIIYLVGFEGLYTLIENGLLESRDVINGRRVYALCEKETKGGIYGTTLQRGRI